MSDYNFWRDLFDTYQSLSDWMKFAWLILPLAFISGMFALVLHYKLAKQRMRFSRETTCSICRNFNRQFYLHLVRDPNIPNLPVALSERRPDHKND